MDIMSAYEYYYLFLHNSENSNIGVFILLNIQHLNLLKSLISVFPNFYNNFNINTNLIK